MSFKRLYPFNDHDKEECGDNEHKDETVNRTHQLLYTFFMLKNNSSSSSSSTEKYGLCLILRFLDEASQFMLSFVSKGCKSIVHRYFLRRGVQFIPFTRAWYNEISYETSTLGYNPILKWLKGNNLLLHDQDLFLCATAARSGHFDTLKWFRDVDGGNCRWDYKTCKFAAEGGQFEILKWAIDNGCPDWKRECVISAAAFGGHLKIVQWLRKEMKCPFDEHTTAAAARGGHLNVLEWLVKEGCKFCKSVCIQESKGIHYDVFKWLSFPLIIHLDQDLLIFIISMLDYPNQMRLSTTSRHLRRTVLKYIDDVKSQYSTIVTSTRRNSTM